MTTQTALEQFRNQRPQPPTMDNVTLPDREFTWRDEPHTYDNDVHIIGTDDTAVQHGSHTVYVTNLYYVIDGIDDYLDRHETTELDVPDAYSRFDQFDPFVSKVTGKSRTGAYGLSRGHLEPAVRVAAGKGGFRSDDLRVVGVEQKCPVVLYGDDAYLIDPDTVSLPENPPTTELTVGDDRTLTVPEDDSRMREGIQTFIEQAEALYDVRVVEHVSVGGGHTFRTDDGTEVSVTARTLLDLPKLDWEPPTGTISRTTSYDETIEGVWEDVDYERGDDLHGGKVVGYGIKLDDPRTTSRVSISGRVKLQGMYVALYVRGDFSEHDSVEVRLKTKTDTIEKFRPEKDRKSAFR